MTSRYARAKGSIGARPRGPRVDGAVELGDMADGAESGHVPMESAFNVSMGSCR
jgi:hypothetical protein